MPAAPAAAAPPSGWPNGRMGYVLTTSGSGFSVDVDDILIENVTGQADVPRWATQQTFTSVSGAQSIFGLEAGGGAEYSRVAFTGDPRWVGTITPRLGTGGSSFRMSLPAAGNYQIATCNLAWHDGAYNLSLEIRPDGGASAGGYANVPVTTSTTRLDALGNGHNTSASWEAAEATARIAFTATSFVEIWGNINASNLCYCSFRVYEV